MDLEDIYGIAYECPFYERKAHCPLAYMDQLLFKERVSLIDHFNKEEIEFIGKYHSKCSQIREKSYGTKLLQVG